MILKVVKDKFNVKLFIVASMIAKLLKNIIPGFIIQKVKRLIIERKVINSFNYEGTLCESEGINLIGNIKAEMGLGQSCRLLANMLLSCGTKLSIYDYETGENLRREDKSFEEYLSEKLPYKINIFHVNPCEIGKLLITHEEMWKGKYNIAFWLWELQEFPEEWIVYCQLFAEIWVPSEFIANSIRKVTQIPVIVIPYWVTVPYLSDHNRKYFRIPENRFIFLIMYDANSTTGRKNPIGAVKAFKHAFSPENKDVGLVIKINNASKRDRKQLFDEMTGYLNIYYIFDTMDKEVVNSLIKCVDVFVSLHRAEGFGLVMAEAMLLDTVVIATNWSANIEFMNSDAACMVKNCKIKNLKTEGLYRKGCIWAEPDYYQAALYMQKLVKDAEYYNGIRVRGKRYVESQLGKKRTLCILKEQLNRLGLKLDG